MNEIKNSKINFQEITLKEKELFLHFLPDGFDRGCEFSFANLFLWGQQKFSIIEDHIVLFSQVDRRSVYPFPIGSGDKKLVIDAIIEDARFRGIPCRITGLDKTAEALLEELYPQKFTFHYDEGSFDYVYAIEDLADLKGKKYHAKRNHINKFLEKNSNYTIEPLRDSNMDRAKEMVALWYEERRKTDPNGDYFEEETAIQKAFLNYEKLDLRGILLYCNSKVVGITMGSQMNADTFDIHFEKAFADINGAYPMINREFARYIRQKHPNIKYLNREEDMGSEGLRKAKRSYYPHHMIEKCWAHYSEDQI